MKTNFSFGLGALAALLVACSGSSGSPASGNGSSSGSTSSGASGSSSGGTGGSTSSGGGSGSSGGASSTSSSGSGTSSSGAGSSSSGSSSGGDAGAASGSGGGAGDAGTSFGPYPSGPYGITVGSVIQDMTWIGYVDDAANAVATTEPYVSYSLDDARKSGMHYAMINLAESDCPGCQKSAGEIASGGPAVVQAGGVVIEVLETTGFVTQATQSSLQAWIGKYQLPVTTVKDPDGTGTATLDTLGQREQAYIVDLTTMKIVDVIQGDITGVGATSGGKALTEMHTLLGK